MREVDAAIIGAGQAGLAMSRCLAARGIDHVDFERGTVGERWKSGSWNSLRLLTPNWMNALPGSPHAGRDPEGYMNRREFISYLEAYASDAPVLTGTEVTSVRPHAGRYIVATSSGVWLASSVVIATGHCDLPHLPAIARTLPPSVLSIHSSQYRSPHFLPSGNVLVVGASASGVQIAEELQRAGRQATLAVGRHTRLPRSWRGRDIFHWLDRIGLLARPAQSMPDLEAARREPSLQLSGHAAVDLPALHRLGIRLAGRLIAANGDRLTFAADLQTNVMAADLRLRRTLERIDQAEDLAGGEPPFESLDPCAYPGPDSLSLQRESIAAVIWATGYVRSYPWLHLPVLSSAGEIEHRDGVTVMPGVYALGLRFLRRRDSSFIRGVGIDAIALSAHLAAYLGKPGLRAA